MKRNHRIGLFGIGLKAYWEQFVGLEKRLPGYVDIVANRFNSYGAVEKANPTVSRQGIPYSSGDYIFQSFESLYPISDNEILTNSKLTQNSGY